MFRGGGGHIDIFVLGEHVENIILTHAFSINIIWVPRPVKTTIHARVYIMHSKTNFVGDWGETKPVMETYTGIVIRGHGVSRL